MRILITNDDGINAPGLAVIETLAAELSDDIWVVAPEAEQSGAGHSLTLAQPLRYRRAGTRRFAVQGTPTDSVVMALNKIIDGPRPDLVLSGVNRGANMAEDVTYSGTIAGAMEGTLAGIPSIALSQAVNQATHKVDWSAAQRFGVDIVRRLLEQGWPAETFINVNFPGFGADKVKGVKVTEQGKRDIGALKIVERVDVRGNPYYWFGLGREVEQPGHDTDLNRVREGWISVTPLHLELTHHEARLRLREALERSFL
ncbi:MAG: 5'/3'-nucleotidase SurE [Pseudomonadota bacterium]